MSTDTHQPQGRTLWLHFLRAIPSRQSGFSRENSHPEPPLPVKPISCFISKRSETQAVIKHTGNGFAINNSVTLC